MTEYRNVWVSDPSDYAEGDKECTMSISPWIAKQKGIE